MVAKAALDVMCCRALRRFGVVLEITAWPCTLDSGLFIEILGCFGVISSRFLPFIIFLL